MIKNRTIFNRILTFVLLIATVYIVFSIISNPFGEQNIILAIIVTIGFIYLGFNKTNKTNKIKN